MLIEWWHRWVNRQRGQRRTGWAAAARRKLLDWLVIEGLEERWAPTAQSFMGPISADFNPSVFAQTVNLSVSITGDGTIPNTPTGTVDFVDGTTDLGTANLDNSGNAILPVTSLTVGSHTIAATYSGDSNYSSSSSQPLTQTVNQAASTTAIASSGNPITFGQPATFRATVSSVAPGGGVPTGTVSFMDGTATLATTNLDSTGAATFSPSGLSSGFHTITAVYGGDENFSGSTSPAIVQTVDQAASSTAISVDVNPTVFGQSASFSVTVTAVDPNAGVPSGAVTLMDGFSPLETATLDSNGTATLPISSLSVGAHAITALYAGDNDFSGSTSAALTQTVAQAATTTVVSASSSAVSASQAVILTAAVNITDPGSVTSSGTITFMDGSSVLGSADLNNGSAQLTTTLSLGNHQIQAVYASDANFTGSTSSAVNVLDGTTNERFVGQVYQNLLSRSADADGLAAWAQLLDQGISRSQVVLDIESTPEYLSDVVQNLYQSFLGRAAVTEGLSVFTAFLANGGTIEQAKAQIIGSPEYFQKNGGTNDGFLNGLYHDVLNRAIDPEGQATFSALLANGASTTDVARQILGSTEAQQDLIQAYFQQYLQRPADNEGLNFFLNALQSGARDQDVSAAILGSDEFFSHV
jgi:hypothetical protein